MCAASRRQFFFIQAYDLLSDIKYEVGSESVIKPYIEFQ